MQNSRDVQILRELVKEYAERAALPVMEERRRLWAAHFSLKTTRMPVFVNFGMWNWWCKEMFGDAALQCEDPFFREHEQALRLELFHHGIGDDHILEPWLTQHAVHEKPRGVYGEPWGGAPAQIQPDTPGGAWKDVPFIREWKDAAKLQAPPHAINEAETRRRTERLREAVGDLIEVDVRRGPIFYGLAADISTTMGGVRGIEQLMLDMYETPEKIHQLAAFLRDGILANQQQAEDAGDYSLTHQMNQAEPYAEELERPRANSGARRRKDLWGFAASQEFTLVSPEFHEEFLLQYQLPILRNFAMCHYGCCDNLTNKIALLRKIPNLRSIAVTPSADLARCAEQIGTDYALSWRPSPVDMVCAGWNEVRIRRVIRDGLRTCRGQHVHLNLKDVETLQGEPGRLARWVGIVREEIDRVG